MAQRLTAIRHRRKKPLPPREWVWLSVGLYDGILLPDATDPMQATPLLPFLDSITALFETPVGLMALFEAPVELDPAQLGSALPLRRNAAGGLSSYADAPQAAADTLTCFLAGQRHVIASKEWVSIDPLVFWNLDAIGTARCESPPLAKRPKMEPARAAKPDPRIKATIERKSELQMESARISQTSIRKSAVIADGARRTARFLFKTCFTIGIILFGLVMVLSLAKTILTAPNPQDGSWLWAVLLFLALAYVLLRIFSGPGGSVTRILRAGQRGGTRNGRAARPAPAPAQRPKSPGLLDKFHGWLLWNTPAGDSLRRGLETRLREMEKLLKAGHIDEALKRALSAAASERRKPPSMASRLPEIRSNLGLNFGQKVDGPSIPIGMNSFQEMRQMYLGLARECEAKGDHGRAAFIYDELLGDYAAALRVLEDAKRYEDAAKLAMARNQSGGDIVRLWYLAGKRDVAIALAERYSCFDVLVRAAENKNIQAGQFIRKIWAERLVQTGDIAQALLVSDDVPGLEEIRLRWLAQAIGQGELDDPAIFHRAVLVLPWRAEVADGAAIAEPGTVGAALESKVSTVLNPSTDPDERTSLLDHLLEGTRKKGWRSEVLQKPNISRLCDNIIRQTIADAIPLTKKSLEGYSAIARAAGLGPLAADLRRIKRAQPTETAPGNALLLPPVSLAQPKWCHLACLPRGRVLVGDPSGTVRILAPSGKIEWADQVTDLAGFVRIRTGRFVILVLGHEAHARRILMLDTLRHTYTQLGNLPLEAWHSESNEHIWMVKSGRRIQALSVVALFNEEAPEFRESWGVTINEEVVVLGFVQNDSVIGWYFQRREGAAGFGLIEYWTAPTRTLSFSTYFLVPPGENERGKTNIYTEPTALRGTIFSYSGDTAGKAAPHEPQSVYMG